MWCTGCADKTSEINKLNRMIDAWSDDSISLSMIRFINQKGLSDEWARFLLDEISKKGESP